jgi:hypothetical protein
MLVLLAVHVYSQAPFTLAVFPGRIILGTRSGFADRITVTVIAGQGFNGTVYFSVSGLPQGVNATFRDHSTFLTSQGTSTTYLQVDSSPNAQMGNYTLTISAMSQGESVFYAVSNQVTLTVKEIGEPRAVSTGSTNGATGLDHAISQIILGLVIGLVLGSVSTYVLIRRKTKTVRRRRPRSSRS